MKHLSNLEFRKCSWGRFLKNLRKNIAKNIDRNIIIKRLRDPPTYVHSRPAHGKYNGIILFYPFSNKMEKYNLES